jgi:hypothetical protein
MEVVLLKREQLVQKLAMLGFIQRRNERDFHLLDNRMLNSNSENCAVVKAALYGGSYPNVLRVVQNRMLQGTE